MIVGWTHREDADGGLQYYGYSVFEWLTSGLGIRSAAGGRDVFYAKHRRFSFPANTRRFSFTAKTKED